MEAACSLSLSVCDDASWLSHILSQPLSRQLGITPDSLIWKSILDGIVERKGVLAEDEKKGESKDGDAFGRTVSFTLRDGKDLLLWSTELDESEQPTTSVLSCSTAV